MNSFWILVSEPFPNKRVSISFACDSITSGRPIWALKTRGGNEAEVLLENCQRSEQLWTFRLRQETHSFAPISERNTWQSIPQSVNLSPAKLQIPDILHPRGQRRV